MTKKKLSIEQFVMLHIETLMPKSQGVIHYNTNLEGVGTYPGFKSSLPAYDSSQVVKVAVEMIKQYIAFEKTNTINHD